MDGFIEILKMVVSNVLGRFVYDWLKKFFDDDD